MSSPQFLAHKERLADLLRRFGVEGELAFQTLAYQYLRRNADRAADVPPEVAERWRAAFCRVEERREVVAFLDLLASQDRNGENLPEWYLFFVGRRFREGSGKFFTPKPIASVMARLLPLADDAVIMDPTCGGGTFLTEAARRWAGRRCTLVANDIDASLIELTMLTLSLSTSPAQIRRYSVGSIFDSASAFQPWRGRVDGILANPPFSLRVEHEPPDSPLYALGYRTSDALFLDAAFHLLRPGGRLVCVLPHSILANREFAALRAALETHWTLRGVIALPEGVFQLNAGTTARVDIVILEKGQGKGAAVVFASAPSVGVRLNAQARAPLASDLETLLREPEARRALGLEMEESEMEEAKCENMAATLFP